MVVWGRMTWSNPERRSCKASRVVIVLETDRLVLSHFTLDDAAFIHELANEPSFLRFVGDRGVRTLDDARAYLRDSPLASYAQHGFGLFRTALKDGDVPIGMCGLLKRDELADVDVGFAFLERYVGRGYATESASAVMDYGYHVLGLDRIVAITSPDNHGSIRVLEKLGLQFEKTLDVPGFEASVLYSPDATGP